MTPSILIACPVLRGQLEPECMHSLLAAREYLLFRGIPHKVLTNECALISANRNEMTASFLNVTNADFLLWVDSDISFPPYAVSRLMSYDLDIVGGVYFRKEREARPLIFDYHDGGFHTRYAVPRVGLFEVDGLGTGFMLIKRRVLERFNPDVVKAIGPPFGIGVDDKGKEVGEDLAFCKRAKQTLGYKIWADPSIPLMHVGKYAYGRSEFEAGEKIWAVMQSRKLYENEISGWMAPLELNWLYETACRMDGIIEIGSWKGRSTHALLSGAVKRTDGQPPAKVIAVDTWKGTLNEQGGMTGPAIAVPDHDVYEEFMANVGQFPNLEAMRMTSLEAAKLVPDQSVDMVFIDGDHSYESVKADIEAWMPKARKMLCGHDWQWHSVQEAVTERFGEPDLAETIWVIDLEKWRA